MCASGYQRNCSIAENGDGTALIGRLQRDGYRQSHEARTRCARRFVRDVQRLDETCSPTSLRLSDSEAAVSSDEIE